MIDNAQPNISSHPLDSVPLFRRWPASPLRNVIYTGLWNSLIGLFLAAANKLFNGGSDSFLRDLVPMLVISNVVGYLIHGTLVGLERLLRGWPSRASGPARLAYRIVVIGSCVVLGIALSRAEDATAVFLVWFATAHPMLAALIALTLAVAVVVLVRTVWRVLRRTIQRVREAQQA